MDNGQAFPDGGCAFNEGPCAHGPKEGGRGKRHKHPTEVMPMPKLPIGGGNGGDQYGAGAQGNGAGAGGLGGLLGGSGGPPAGAAPV